MHAHVIFMPSDANETSETTMFLTIRLSPRIRYCAAITRNGFTGGLEVFEGNDHRGRPTWVSR
jgi:hypothetical protein